MWKDHVHHEQQKQNNLYAYSKESLADAKWVLRVLAMETESELKEDQLLEGDVEEVASLSVFQIAEGLDFILISRLNYLILAVHRNQTTWFHWALNMSLEAVEGLRR